MWNVSEGPTSTLPVANAVCVQDGRDRDAEGSQAPPAEASPTLSAASILHKTQLPFPKASPLQNTEKRITSQVIDVSLMLDRALARDVCECECVCVSSFEQGNPSQ